ncbi:MAG TPA: fumarylacetoacetate hydrolase family protein [Trebonia sp.]|jgi:2-keto-4-pentenoate hydratase/2-oxohepta-3-ene-1,7-dioic acid hydratase in catechol pathway
MKFLVYGPDRRVGAIDDGLGDGEFVDVHDAGVAYLQATGDGDPAERAARLAPERLADFIAAGMTARGRPMTEDEAYKIVRADEPLGYWKLPGEATGPDGEIPYPARCDRLDFEGEVAVVVGKPGKDIAIDEAMDHVWGVTIFNDWSIRSRPRKAIFPFSLNLDKNFDGSTSIGPWIAVGDIDPANLHIELRVNGQIRPSFSTADMVYSFAEYIHFLSRDFTLLPGDMIASGTGSGTGADSSRPGPDGESPPDLFLQSGDVVEVRVPEIGLLKNRIVPA